MERRAGELHNPAPITEPKESYTGESEDGESVQFLQRLRVLQAKAGWNNMPAATTLPTPTTQQRPESLPSHPLTVSNRHCRSNLEGKMLFTIKKFKIATIVFTLSVYESIFIGMSFRPI